MSNLSDVNSTPTRLSQSHLNLLETCPRKFQHIYLDQLGSLVSPEQQEKQTWGSRFHLLMQQRELGLPVESLLKEDTQLERSITALVGAVPEIIMPDSQTWRDAEHYRTLNFQGYLLTVVYDLLITNAEKAQILDWKTYLQPENQTVLAKNWQTRLYLYLLAETSEYLPEQISMTYWFVKLPTQPQSLTFTYNSTQHQKTKQDLTRLLNQLDQWLERYRHKEIPFPQVPEEKGECHYCNFALLCQRTLESRKLATSRDRQTSVAEIEEVSL